MFTFATPVSTASTTAKRLAWNIALIRGVGAQMRFRVVNHDLPVAEIGGQQVKKAIFVTRYLSNAEKVTLSNRVSSLIGDIQRGVPDATIESRIQSIISSYGGTHAELDDTGKILVPAVPGPMLLADIQEEYRAPGTRSAARGKPADDANADLA
jgi:hypothetical protein